MDFETVISERYSVRKFENRHLEHAVIEKILHAGHIAPTGCNYQPQRILVLNTDGAMEKLKQCTKCHFDAPCAMAICYNVEETWTRPYDGALSAPVDAAIVATHMMLAAQNEGVGTCWVMHFNPEKLKETFHFPQHIEPLALLVMGYPAKDAEPLPLHSAYRPLEDIVRYDDFEEA